MTVSVVQIRPMGVCVLNGLVLMPVCVTRRRINLRMRVRVMAFVVPVCMRVRETHVTMSVMVLVSKQQSQGDHQQQRRHDLSHGNRFLEYHRGKGNAEEWRTREEHLGTCRADSLSRSNV